MLLELLFERIAARFSRPEPRHRARIFVQGILSGLDRRNGWTLAEYAGEHDPNGMQRLLTTSRWDVDGVRDDLRDWVLEQFGDRNAVLVPGELGFPKKGSGSVGVHRRYNPLTGRTENVQLGVFLCGAVAGRWALLDRELFLPRTWIADAQRCRQLGVPDGVGFASRPQLVRYMLDRIVARTGPKPWLAGDEVYGDDPELRSWLHRRVVPYVLATQGPEQVGALHRLVSGTQDTASHIPRLPWERHRTPDGSTCYDWVRLPRTGEEPPAPGWQMFLLIRRSTVGAVRFGYYRCHARAETPVPELVRVAELSTTSPDRLARAGDDLGLDQYQVRRYDAWYRHVTLCLLAGAYLAVAG